MLYRFLCPRLDGSVIDVAIEADDLQAAVDDFADNHWQTEMSGTFAVWCSVRRSEADVPRARPAHAAEPGLRGLISQIPNVMPPIQPACRSASTGQQGVHHDATTSRACRAE